MSRLLITGLAITLGLVITTRLAYADNMEVTVGSQAGKCRSSAALVMCDESRLVWHVYAKARYAVSDHFNLVGSVDHYSSFDGQADLIGDEDNQTGAFDHAGIGIEFKF